MSDESNPDWTRDGRWVVSEVSRLGKTVEHVEQEMAKLTDRGHALELKMAAIGFRQSVWGVIAAAVPAIVGALLWYITTHHG